MINGDPNDFVETVRSGQEIFYLFDNKRYMIQGYWKNGKNYLEIQQHIPWADEIFWISGKDTPLQCLEEFLNAPIFNGKTFWEAEQEIEWLDDQKLRLRQKVPTEVIFDYSTVQKRANV